MRRLVFMPALGLGLLFIGCGSSTPKTAPVAFAPMNGNFAMTAVSQTGTNTAIIGGQLQTDSSGKVSGILHITESAALCFLVTEDVPFTGSLSQGQLVGSSSSVNSQVVSVNAMVSSDGKTITSGTYSVSGTGCAGGDHGTVTGFQMQPFTGNYTGSINLGGPVPISFFMPLTQSAMPDLDGLFRFSATAMDFSAGGSCGFIAGSVDTSNSFAAGSLLLLSLDSAGSSTPATITFAGVATDASAKTINGKFTMSTGPCVGQSAPGTISHP